jgi:purine nucleosidase
MEGQRLVIDTDGGIDDAVALWWALTQPDIDLAAVVVTAGNVGRAQAASNVARILIAAGRPDVPVVLGADGPVGPSPLAAHRATFVHGEDGLGGSADRWPTGGVTPLTGGAGALLWRLADRSPGTVSLVTIGPLSTTARVLQAAPGLAGRLGSLTVMGGAVRVVGNALPWGEANIGHDPDAAALVVAADWAAPPMLVGLDVTLTATLHDDDLALAAQGRTPAARFLAEPLAAYADFYRRAGATPPGTVPCHDLLAVIAAVDPTVVTDAPVAPLAVDTGRSAAWGATVVDLRPTPQSTTGAFHPWRVALGADQVRFRAAFRRLCGD